MQISDMNEKDSIDVLKRVHLGRLACAQYDQPYVTPIFFACNDSSLYSFTTIGQRLNWMRANPLVCLEVDDVTDAQNWLSVIVFGRFAELPDTPHFTAERELAYELLRRRPIWWEPAYVKTTVNAVERPLELTYFRIRIDKITGRRSIPDATLRPVFRDRISRWLGHALRGG